ncbi:type IV pilus secretin PilQ family protein [Vibrio diabolicus]|jgi:type IV pilus assembly protein PilQ|uniref:Type IV pilus secretin PilQ family protein n=5 Tax=Vibrio TaxID=662 RepID=A0AA92LSF7_9VIBR|nr:MULTISPECIES: type IV pilus secretin PilQ family protein [Vibrio]MCR9493890.1 type IV pilus secretin PilQ family protein [Vibrio alginolyticus]MEA3482233.1 type IV pilus secretin PilQ family protein [Pseudomonadota bacterium]ACY50488.1 type IV pilus biogenesis protein PilQ [Vibrio antiquarius]EDN56552.1 type IV pilus secretin PilQ subfamily [Vibrio antiquarius]MCE9832083.1 type IV pilus secretin PilQ family protein [Vibrio diabolicus]
MKMRQGLTRTPRILTGLFSLWLFVFLAPLVAAEEVSSNALKSIDFRTNKDKDAVIVVELASPAAIVDVKRVQEGLSIDLLNTSVKDEQLYLLDVKDFSTVVESVEVFRDTSTTRLVAHINEEYTHDYRLTGRFLEIKVAKIKPNEKAPDKSILEKEGKLISINFQDIPVRNVLQLIADYNQFNLVVSDSVEGNLTLRLDGVPWQQVLDIILQVKGLDKRVDGNVILVAPTDELDLREKQQLEKQQLEQTMGELSSEIIKVNFAKASDIAEMINGEGNISMLSERGSMTIDERTNSLLIRELPENIEVIREIIESLDIPVKQVQIEARIVTINEGNMDELGIRWGFTSINGNNTVGGSIENNLATIGLYNGGGEGEDGGDGDGVGIDDFLNVNLAATSPNATSIAFQVAKLGSDTLLDLELSALQQESKAEIISSPRLITTNKKPAYIEQGTEIPYLESSSSGATTVTFKKAVLSLKVTPQITPDNRLVLDLSVTQDRPGQVVKTGTGEAVAIDTQRIGTQVLVNNGETVVLGGIFQHSITNSVDKVPLLGDLPLLGALFRRSYENVGKSELLIFVTPKVVIQ